MDPTLWLTAVLIPNLKCVQENVVNEFRTLILLIINIDLSIALLTIILPPTYQEDEGLHFEGLLVE